MPVTYKSQNGTIKVQLVWYKERGYNKVVRSYIVILHYIHSKFVKQKCELDSKRIEVGSHRRDGLRNDKS